MGHLVILGGILDAVHSIGRIYSEWVALGRSVYLCPRPFRGRVRALAVVSPEAVSVFFRDLDSAGRIMGSLRPLMDDPAASVVLVLIGDTVVCESIEDAIACLA